MIKLRRTLHAVYACPFVHATGTQARSWSDLVRKADVK